MSEEGTRHAMPCSLQYLKAREENLRLHPSQIYSHEYMVILDYIKLREALAGGELDTMIVREDPQDSCCGHACTMNGCHETHPSGKICVVVAIRFDRETDALRAAQVISGNLGEQFVDVT